MKKFTPEQKQSIKQSVNDIYDTKIMQKHSEESFLLAAKSIKHKSKIEKLKLFFK